MILQLVLHNNHNIFMALQSSCGCNILHEVVERRSPACSSTCNDHVQHHRAELKQLVAAKGVTYARSYPECTEEPTRREGATGPERPKRMRPDGAEC